MTTSVLIDNIPAALKAEPRWLVWKAGPVKPDGKFDKIPADPATGNNLTGGVSGKTMSFDQAVAALGTGRFSGLGFHPKGSRFVIGDLDRVISPDRSITPWAWEDVVALGTYCEVSPSGTGLRWIAVGNKPGPEQNNREQGCELYDGGSSQFLTITGVVMPGFDEIREDIQPKIDAWYHKRIAKGPAASKAAQAEGPGNNLTVEEIQTRLLTSEKGRKLWEGDWADLGYPSRSEHALGLLDQLAVLTAGDVEKMREVYFESPFALTVYAGKAGRTFEGDAAKAIQGAQGRFTLDIKDVFSAIPAEQGAAASPVLEGLHLFHDVDELPAAPMAWLIEGFIPGDGFTLFFGDSGSFKSFTTQDIIYHVAAGRPWCGREVQKGPCLVVVGEGSSGIRARGLAWKRHHGVKGRLDVFYCTVPIAFSLAQQVTLLRQQIQQLEAQHGPLAALLVDTLAQCFGPGDENSAKDMAAFIRGVNAAMGHRGARIVVHHTGHGAKDRARGAYALPAALDASFQVQRVEHAKSGPGCILECRKQRDAEMSETLAFATLKIELGKDAKGRSVSSLVLEEIPASDVTVTPAKLDDKQRIIISRVRNSFGTGAAMTTDSLVAELVEDGSYARASTARRAIERLVAKRVIHLSPEGGLRCF